MIDLSVLSGLSNGTTYTTVPDTPEAPFTTIRGENVVIKWSEPKTNGASISSYTVKIRHDDGVTFSEETVNCSGSDSLVI